MPMNMLNDGFNSIGESLKIVWKMMSKKKINMSAI